MQTREIGIFQKISGLTPEWKNCLCPKSNLDWVFFMVPDVLVYKSNVNCFKQNFSEWKPNACLAAMSQSWSLYKIIHFGYSIKKSMGGSDRSSKNGPPANKLFLCFCIINGIVLTMFNNFYQILQMWQNSTTHQNGNLLDNLDSCMSGLPTFLTLTYSL